MLTYIKGKAKPTPVLLLLLLRFQSIPIDTHSLLSLSRVHIGIEVKLGCDSRVLFPGRKLLILLNFAISTGLLFIFLLAAKVDCLGLAAVNLVNLLDVHLMSVELIDFDDYGLT